MDTCHGKQCYTKREAQTTLNHRTKGRAKVRHGRPEFLRIYACDRCGHWHLTSKHHYDEE